MTNRDLRIRLEWKPQDCWVGAFWKSKMVDVPCDDPQCWDSTWDHECGMYSYLRKDVWVCLVPMMPIHVSWTPLWTKRMLRKVAKRAQELQQIFGVR